MCPISTLKVLYWSEKQTEIVRGLANDVPGGHGGPLQQIHGLQRQCFQAAGRCLWPLRWK